MCGLACLEQTEKWQLTCDTHVSKIVVYLVWICNLVQNKAEQYMWPHTHILSCKHLSNHLQVTSAFQHCSRSNTAAEGVDASGHNL